jgi:hypothetical protein
MKKFVNIGSENISWGPEVSVDFEAYYKKKVHDIDTLGQWHYNRHPKSKPFLVAVSDGDTLWVGDPQNFFWPGLTGRRVCAHNASFDNDVYEAGVEQGRFPRVVFKEWICTADLATYLCGHRNLSAAAKMLLNEDISKQVRSDANGKTWEDMQAEEITLEDGSKTTFAQHMIDYAGGDTINLRIWKEHGHRWPERELRLSQKNIIAGHKGVRINVPELVRCISLVSRVIAESVDALPWVKRGRKEGSPIGVAEECRASNIPCPPVKSGPNGDPEMAEEWLEKYSALCPWVQALKNLRRGKKMLATLETMHSRLRPDGTIAFNLLYWGTHTGRFAGVGGLNFLNFNKEPLFAEFDKECGRGVDIRGLILAREGKRFAICDLSQIEPRCLNWAIGNEELLSQVRTGMAIYEAFARTATGWRGGKLKDEDKYGYALAKAQVLALGYQAAGRKFIVMALQPMYGNLDLCANDEKVAMDLSVDKNIYIEIEREIDGEKMFVPEIYDAAKHGDSDKIRNKRFIVIKDPEGGPVPVREHVYGINARVIVANFRKSNPLIAGEDGIWNRFDQGIKRAAQRGEDFVIEMPDGGEMRYRNCRLEKRRKIDKETGEAYTKTEVRCDVGHKSTSTYGGKITENFCQRFARDVFVEGMLRADEAGFPFVFNVYDEAIFEVDDDGTKLGRKIEAPDDTNLGKCLGLLAQTPSWAPGLPVAAEGVWADRYMK